MDYIVRSYDPCIIAGDFNMGLFEVITLLEQRQVRLCLLSFFPWRVKGVTTPSTDVEQNDGIPFHVPDEAMRFDSMGIFSTRLFQEVHQRHLQVDWILRGQRHNLPEFEDQQKVQGHPAIRYRGGWKLIEHTIRQSRACVIGRVRPSTDVEQDDNPAKRVWDKAVVKMSDRNKNRVQDMFDLGAHYPLIIFFGRNPHRAPKSMHRRLERAREREAATGGNFLPRYLKGR